MRQRILSVIPALLAASNVAAINAPPAPPGKVDTGRTIELSVVAEGTPAEIFDLWASPAGISRFFAPAAVIDPAVGGRYWMIFAPAIDSEGASQGTKGAHVLVWDPPRRLSFEWATFVTTRVEGVAHPPVVTAEERYARPYPVWVDLLFEPAPGSTRKTTVRLWCRGFETGAKWDEALRYFHRNWALTLGRLAAVRVADTPEANPKAPR